MVFSLMESLTNVGANWQNNFKNGKNFKNIKVFKIIFYPIKF